MTTEKQTHLSRKQLIRAVVDPMDLAPGSRVHLVACDQCNSERTAIERELAQLSRKAAESVPMSRKEVVLPSKMKRAGVQLKPWQPSIGVAVMALVVFLLLWSPIRLPFQSMDQSSVPLSDPDSASLMAEVYHLIDSPLPPVYLEICSESELYFDDSFVEFIVPLADDESLTFLNRKKGVMQC